MAAAAADLGEEYDLGGGRGSRLKSDSVSHSISVLVQRLKGNPPGAHQKGHEDGMNRAHLVIQQARSNEACSQLAHRRRLEYALSESSWAHRGLPHRDSDTAEMRRGCVQAIFWYPAARRSWGT